MSDYTDEYSLGQPEQQPLPVTSENISSAYKSMFGKDAPQDFIDSVSKQYGSSYNNMDQVMGDMATSAANSGTPFTNKAGDQGGFTSGAQYYASQGYTPGSSSYEGVPTSWIDPKTGKVVASYGTVEKGSDPRGSIQSGNWTWNDVAATPEGYSTNLARAKTDEHEFQKFAKVAALVAAAVATGGALAPELMGGAGVLGGAEAFPVTGGALIPGTELGAVGTGALGAGGAGAVGAGSLTAGLTPEMIAAGEAALPQTMADIGGLSSTAAGGAGAAGAGGLTDAQATALMQNNLLPAEMQIPASQGLTATEAMRYANMAKSALSSLGGGTGGAGAGGAGGAVPTAAAGGAGASALSQMAQSRPEFLTTGSAPTTNTSGLIDYKPLAYIDPSHYANVSDIKPLSLADRSPFESGLHAAHGGHIQESMGRHPELQDIDPRLLSMIMQSMSFQDGDKRHVPEFITGATGHYVKGKGDGQSDDIPAMLADGEFVWDADTVAQLGNGSSDAGAKFLDKFREAVRSHKRSAPNDKIPPKASPLQYVKEAMKNTEKE